MYIPACTVYNLNNTASDKCSFSQNATEMFNKNSIGCCLIKSLAIFFNLILKVSAFCRSMFYSHKDVALREENIPLQKADTFKLKLKKIAKLLIRQQPIQVSAFCRGMFSSHKDVALRSGNFSKKTQSL